MVADRLAGDVYHAHYQRLADVHFPMVAIFYHYQFRTKKSLEISLDWLQAGSHHRHDPKNKGDICHLGRRLLEARKDMCRYPSAHRRDFGSSEHVSNHA